MMVGVRKRALKYMPFMIMILMLVVLEAFKSIDEPYEIGRSCSVSSYTRRTGIDIIDEHLFRDVSSSGIINFRSAGKVNGNSEDSKYYEYYFTFQKTTKDVDISRGCLFIKDEPTKTGPFIMKKCDLFVRPGNVMYKVKENFPYKIPPPKEDNNCLVFANWLGIRKEYLVEANESEICAYEPLIHETAFRVNAWHEKFEIIRWIQNGLWIGVAILFGFLAIQLLRRKIGHRKWFSKHRFDFFS